MTDNFINENYTFTKDTFINNELDTSLSYDFYSKSPWSVPGPVRCVGVRWSWV